MTYAEIPLQGVLQISGNEDNGDDDDDGDDSFLKQLYYYYNALLDFKQVLWFL